MGGRLRPHRAHAARGRDDRPGAPRRARGRRPRRREGAATAGRPGHLPGSRPARAVRPEDGDAADVPSAGRRAGRDRPPLHVAPQGARLPPGGAQHRADARRARPLPAARCARRLRGAGNTPAPCHGRGPGRARPGGAGGRGPERGCAPAARVLLPPDPDRGLLPRGPSPRQPHVVAGAHLLPRLRHGRRGRRERRASTCCSC